MLTFLWVVAAVYVLVVVAWWWNAWYYRHGLDLPAFRLTPTTQWPVDQPAPALAVVIACHNEQDRIEGCVRRLVAQEYPNLRIVVANDRSTDRTGEILAGLAAEDDRIRVVKIDELPAGWIGKTHAVANAAAGCDADYLLFLDGDVELSPHALVTTMLKVCADGLDFLSLLPHLELRSRWERLLTPPASVVIALWNRPSVTAREPAAEAVHGNGQFLLIKRTTHEALGGHAGVASELAEDDALAQKAHAAGYRCWTGLGAGLYVTSRTGGFRRTVNSTARVLIGGVRKTSHLLAATQILLAGGFAPAWIIPAAALCLWAGLDPRLCVSFAALALLHMIGMVLTLRQAFAFSLAKRGSLLWFPIGAAIVAGILFWCAFLVTGRSSVRWGPTRYRLDGTRVVGVAGQ